MATGTKSVFLKVNNTSNERPKNEGCLSPTDQSLFLALFVTPYCPAENAAGSLGNRNGRYMMQMKQKTREMFIMSYDVHAQTEGK
jgi:hypothetical protein